MSIASRLAMDGVRREPVPAVVPGEFVVDLLEDTGMMDMEEAGVMLSILEWVEVEAQGVDDLVEGLSRLRGAVMAMSFYGRWKTERSQGRRRRDDIGWTLRGRNTGTLCWVERRGAGIVLGGFRNICIK